MREAAFVRKNKEKWALFENVLTKKTQVSPDKLSDLYIEITDDLSYAKTFYPRSNTTNYLNTVAASAHLKIYKTKKEGKNSIVNFFKIGFPTAFYQHHTQLGIAFLVFVFLH